MAPAHTSMFEAIFNQFPSPVTILKANIPRFTIIAMNDERRNAPGTPADVIGRDAFDIYKPWDKASEQQFSMLKDGLIEAVKEKRQVKLPLLYFEVSNADETKVECAWVQSEITPILDATGKVDCLVSIVRNVTELELNRLAVEELKEKELALKDELSSVNETLKSTNDELLTVNEELSCTNEELAAANEELAATNNQLIATNEKLMQSRHSLEVLNAELEERVLRRTKALAESECRFRTMFETISQMAWSVTNKAEATFFNKSWYDFTGLDYEASKMFGWKEVIHPDDLAASINKFSNMQAGLSNGGGIENRFRRFDGQYRWHLTRMLPIKNEDGDIDMWIGTATEIHELKELQQQKDDFISIASHELKTPVTTLKASLQLLDRMKDDPSPQALPKLIIQSRRSMQKISTLIDDLLNIGRLQQKEIYLNKTRFIVSELLNAACNPISLAGRHHIHILGDKELKAYADEHHIDQVVTNLVSNAVKYAANSEEIILLIEEADKMVKVSVKDSGPGIPKEKVPFLFERYYRADAKSHQGSGLGLGLFISSEIIKRHGGQIGVESELGRGSKFWFTIPTQAADQS
ncbi:MAG: two-component system, OmpR family, phosphate regulon sensor histidine kinase PhoR [Mucilaginibacter sp.]|nr:two-component system, OmpR family, phosphate regulon sensor histidine kinase PhoR [Mucilaginibacter sp.]